MYIVGDIDRGGLTEIAYVPTWQIHGAWMDLEARDGVDGSLCLVRSIVIVSLLLSDSGESGGLVQMRKTYHTPKWAFITTHVLTVLSTFRTVVNTVYHVVAYQYPGRALSHWVDGRNTQLQWTTPNFVQVDIKLNSIQFVYRDTLPQKLDMSQHQE